MLSHRAILGAPRPADSVTLTDPPRGLSDPIPPAAVLPGETPADSHAAKRPPRLSEKDQPHE